jgi:CHASE3 domain sensor protein
LSALTRRVRAAAETTPGRYRLWSAATALLLLVTALAGWAAAAGLRSGTDRIRNNAGPVLVATQQLVASLAEADAAATAAFLSGRQEDPESRRLYEQALARAGQQIEDVSALIGSDPATHASLKDLSVAVTRYAGLVEAGRATNQAGVAGADRYLVDALNLLATTVADDATRLTDSTQRRFERDENRRDTGVLPAVAVAAVALIVLVAAQLWVFRQSRRLVNLPMALGTILLIGGIGWLVAATLQSGNDIQRARADGYDSITLTSRIQTTAYRAKADETVALINNDQARRASASAAAKTLLGDRATPAAVDAVRAGRGAGVPGLLTDAAAVADSDTERAAVAEMLVRWQRYQDTSAQLRATTDPTQARAVAVGPASATFNGFNFSVESVLSDNRSQFLDGLASAARRVAQLTLVALFVPLIAALGALGGLQLRINEYP